MTEPMNTMTEDVDGLIERHIGGYDPDTPDSVQIPVTLSFGQLKALKSLKEELGRLKKSRDAAQREADRFAAEAEAAEARAVALKQELDAALSGERGMKELLHKVEGERDEARILVSKYAREAGEAIGRLEMSEAAGIVDGWRQRAEKAERELAEVKEAEPDGPGAFEGDIFFGDPRNSTRGTHCWQGGRWERLPSDAEVLMDLLASARSRAETAERELAAFRELREGDLWPQELRDALDALEDRFDVDLVSTAFMAKWVRAAERAEAALQGAQADLVRKEGVLKAAERYRTAKAAHHEAFLTYAAGTDPAHLNAMADAEREAKDALLEASLQPQEGKA